MELYELTEAPVRELMTIAMRADPTAVGAGPEELAAQRRLDRHTAEFLRRARRLTLAGAVAHRHGTNAFGREMCQNCGTGGPCWTLQRVAEVLTAYLGAQPYGIDRAEAWRRAEEWLTDSGRHQVAVVVEGFAEGYVARSVPSYGPDERAHLVVVDRRTGAISVWPHLPEDVLAEQYCRYKLGLHLGLDPGLDHT